MEMYSMAVYPLFVWNIWFYRKRLHNLFSMQDLNIDIRLKSVDVRHPQNAIIATADRVRHKINSLKANYPDAVAEVEALGKELSELGVKEKETYLFLQGHHLMENVILKLLTPVCTKLRQERESDIRRFAVHDQQYRNELSAYQHSQMGITEALRKNTHYRECELYEKMREDMKRFLSMLPERGGEQQQNGKDFQSSDDH